MEKAEIQSLIRDAFEAQKFAYVPYSRFHVGAALLGKNGMVYKGCNIENAALSPGLCAERVAMAKAISAGERHFTAIAICGGPLDAPAVPEELFYPCGVCRQMLAEFCSGEMIVICASDEQHYQQLTLAELLPYPYPPDNH